VRALDLDALEREAADLDATLRRTPGIDAFCSSTDWVVPAHRALGPPRDLFCRRGEHGWALFARRIHQSDAGYWRSLEPLEASWCLASPLACDGDPRAFARELVEALQRDAPRDVLFVAGLAPASPLSEALGPALAERYYTDLTSVPPTRRYRADLREGVAGFLTRRSSTFRARLRQAERKADGAGIAFEAVRAGDEGGAAALYARLLAVEARSWKGLDRTGLATPEMAGFYRDMLPRVARRGGVRAQVARHDGRDVAIIVGAVTETLDGLSYRGLQFSFDDDYRAFSLGNLAQLAQIRALCGEKVALYDLGSEVDYKRRWGEQCFETATLVAIPRERRSEGG
jgi:CelD/BcsL family acetyltransferase involved in cellulose biosynthesis